MLVGPEILVVGDVSARKALLRAIQDAGYEVILCLEREFAGRIDDAPMPAAIVLCMQDVDSQALLTRLRRTRDGASVPVLLHAPLGQKVRELADVIELGADHFLADPVDAELLREALFELAGPPSDEGTGARSPASSDPRSNSDVPDGGAERTGSGSIPGPGWFETTEKLAFDHAEESSAGRSAPRVRHPVLGDVHRTLDEVEARLDASLPHEDYEHDAVDRELASFGLESVPQIEPEGATIDADDPHTQLDLIGMGLGAPADVPASAAFSPGEALAHHSLRTGGGPKKSPQQSEESSEEFYDQKTIIDAPSELGGQSRLGKLAGPFARRASDPPPQGAGMDATQALASRDFIASNPSAPRVEDERAPLFQLPDGLAGQSQGQLAHLELPRLLWLLVDAAFNGVLYLERAQASITLAFRNGRIVTMRHAGDTDSLPYCLWRDLLLTQAERDGLLASSAQIAPERIVGRLVRQRLLKASEAKWVGERWVEQSLARWWASADGNWRIEAPNWLCTENFVSYDPASKFIHACMRYVDTALLEDWIGGRAWAPRRRDDSVYPQGSAEEWLATRFHASAAVRQWLRLVDGRSIDELVDALRARGFELENPLGLCYALDVLGLIELPDDERNRAELELEIDQRRLEARLRVARHGSYFEFLGVAADAPLAEIRAALESLERALDDDRFEPESRKKLASVLDELRQTLRAAKAVLGDPESRMLYAHPQGHPRT